MKDGTVKNFTLDKIDAKLAAAEEKLRQLRELKKRKAAAAEAAAKKATRALDTRRKILLGAWVMSVAESQGVALSEMQIAGGQSLDAFLTLPRDREIFGLSGESQDSSPACHYPGGVAEGGGEAE